MKGEYDIFFNQNIPTTTEPPVVFLQPGGQFTITVPTEIRSKSQAIVIFNGNGIKLASNTPSTVNIQLDILRNGQSIINGPQTQFASLLPPSDKNLVINETFTTIDTLESSMTAIYTFIIINSSAVDVIGIDFYSAIVAIKRHHKIAFTSQVPPLESQPIVVLSPGSSYDVNLTSDFSTCNMPLLLYNLNIVRQVATSTVPVVPKLLLNVLRDGHSISNGPQIINKFIAPPIISTEITLEYLMSDCIREAGKHDYTFRLTNDSTNETVELDYYTATVIPSFTTILKQNIPSITAPPVVILTPRMTYDFNVRFKIDSMCSINTILFFMFNVRSEIDTTPGSLASVQFEIIRDNTFSVTNGPQNMWVFPASGNHVQQIGLTSILVDKLVSESKKFCENDVRAKRHHNYTFRLINTSLTDTLSVDFISARVLY